jgi:hypothetical protein
MRVDRFFLRVEEKNPASPWRASLESTNLALARVYGFLPWADKEPDSSMERQKDARGRRAGMAPLRHRGSSLSWRGWWTTPRKTNGDVAAGPPPCRTSPLELRAIPATETRLRRRRGRWKLKKGIEGGRQGVAFIKKVRMRK